MFQRIVMFGAVLTAVGCAAKSIEVGAGPAGPAATLPPPIDGGGNSPPSADWPSVDACAAQSNLGMRGVWNGYYGKFTNPVADFQLDIRGASETGGLCGTITFEPQKPPPPPVSDPEGMYPPDRAAELASFTTTIYSVSLLSGFAYTIVSGRAQGSHAQVSFSTNQPYEGWCALQPRYACAPDSPAPYNCLPNWGGGGLNVSTLGYGTGCFVTDPRTSAEVPVSCARLHLCNGARARSCNQDRCGADRTADGVATFDFSADEATGTLQSMDVLLKRTH
jgi:hypothetical protein